MASLGDAATVDERALGLLNAILRSASGLGERLGKTSSTAVQVAAPVVAGSLRVLDDWGAVPLQEQQAPCTSLDKDYASMFRVLSTIKGPDRTPPNRFDLVIYEPASAAVLGLKQSGRALRVDVPDVPGAFVLPGLLAPEECAAFVATAEQIGFVPDEPSSRTASLAAATRAGLDERAANFTMLADDSILDQLLERCRGQLPSELEDGSRLVGINARFRMYKYLPGSVYRPHIDGKKKISSYRHFEYNHLIIHETNQIKAIGSVVNACLGICRRCVAREWQKRGRQI